MKKICISFSVILIISLSVVGVFLNARVTENVEYLRIHIRANSNLDEDQNVKYLVKDAVVDFITPYICDVKTKSEAEEILNGLTRDIERVADGVLERNGFLYKSEASVKNEKFPTRVYDDLTLDCGFYDALIINLGSGSGDNWWCVAYPPLCFTEAKVGYIYKSKILGLIRDFKNRNSEGI